MKNILITGGLGHIGSQLIRKLDTKYRLTVVDDFTTQRYCSLFDMNRPIHFMEASFDDIDDSILDDTDIVVHLAAHTNAPFSFNKVQDFEQCNYRMTMDFAKRCKDRVDLFVFPSSTSVYGTAKEVMYEDDDDNLKPQSPYAGSKINAEKGIRECFTDSSTSYVIFRFGTIFGTSPGMRFHTSINRFALQASMKQPLTVWKENYHHKRPYLGLNDTLNSIMLLLEKPDNWNEIYNVVTLNEELANIVAVIQKHADVEIQFVNTPLVNQYSYEVSTAKLEKLGFKPTDDLEASLMQTMRLLRNIS